jgi:hypothetical protein
MQDAGRCGASAAEKSSPFWQTPRFTRSLNVYLRSGRAVLALLTRVRSPVGAACWHYGAIYVGPKEI